MPTAHRSAQGRWIATLPEAAELGPERVGVKAANLARSAGAGLPVPAAVVVLPEALAAWHAAQHALLDAAAELPGDRFVVRSSARAEDTADASYAGQYESLLDVPAEELPEAVRRVFESASADRVAAYRHARTPAEPSGSGGAGMAVLVQVMVAADAAGVAFTANPLSGDRDEVVISAVRGLGERLVAGEAVGDQWVVHGDRADCLRATERALDAPTALAVAGLARRAEALFGGPQDLEWATAGDRVFLLQARPMTALPEQVGWTPPHPGWWLRNFRLGEWLPEPLTPLFADWLLPALERGTAAAMHGDARLPLRPEHAILHGWYYTTPQPRLARRSLPLELARHPRSLLVLPGVVLLLLRPDLARRSLARQTHHWRERLLPRYREAVQAGDAVVELAPGAELERLVDAVGEIAGEYSWSVATLAGSQWKIEARLARFLRRHLPGVEVSAQLLVSGLPGTEPALPGHAVHSADWYWPTAGETGQPSPGREVRVRHQALGAERRAAEARCRAVLTGRRPLRRFDRLLATAQHYAVVREQQTRDFTLGWPLLRRCLLRLGRQLKQRGLVADAADVCFLTRAELRGALEGRAGPPLQASVERRRHAWERQRRLVAPLELGRAPALGRRVYVGAVEAMRSGHRAGGDDGLVGQPASPGRATGRVRVILEPADFDRFQPGEILVTRATAPAWTPLFAKAAAVVTDGGTLAAHASLVAREYGIPAVVATGNATSALRDGQTVTVDGNAGFVHVQKR